MYVCEYSIVIAMEDLYPTERARRKTHNEMTHKTIKHQQREKINKIQSKKLKYTQ